MIARCQVPGSCQTLCCCVRTDTCCCSGCSAIFCLSYSIQQYSAAVVLVLDSCTKHFVSQISYLHVLSTYRANESFVRASIPVRRSIDYIFVLCASRSPQRLTRGVICNLLGYHAYCLPIYLQQYLCWCYKLLTCQGLIGQIKYSVFIYLLVCTKYFVYNMVWYYKGITTQGDHDQRRGVIETHPRRSHKGGHREREREHELSFENGKHDAGRGRQGG